MKHQIKDSQRSGVDCEWKDGRLNVCEKASREELGSKQPPRPDQTTRERTARHDTTLDWMDGGAKCVLFGRPFSSSSSFDERQSFVAKTEKQQRKVRRGPLVVRPSFGWWVAVKQKTKKNESAQSHHFKDAKIRNSSGSAIRPFFTCLSYPSFLVLPPLLGVPMSSGGEGKQYNGH